MRWALSVPFRYGDCAGSTCTWLQTLVCTDKRLWTVSFASVGMTKRPVVKSPRDESWCMSPFASQMWARRRHYFSSGAVLAPLAQELLPEQNVVEDISLERCCKPRNFARVERLRLTLLR
jgi:hypothetical protein